MDDEIKALTRIASESGHMLGAGGAILAVGAAAVVALRKLFRSDRAEAAVDAGYSQLIAALRQDIDSIRIELKGCEEGRKQDREACEAHAREQDARILKLERCLARSPDARDRKDDPAP